MICFFDPPKARVRGAPAAAPPAGKKEAKEAGGAQTLTQGERDVTNICLLQSLVLRALAFCKRTRAHTSINIHAHFESPFCSSDCLHEPPVSWHRKVGLRFSGDSLDATNMCFVDDVYIYIYMYTYMYVYIYIYIYTHIYTYRY